jgi:hypothetical protein
MPLKLKNIKKKTLKTKICITSFVSKGVLSVGNFLHLILQYWDGLFFFHS